MIIFSLWLCYSNFGLSTTTPTCIFSMRSRKYKYNCSIGFCTCYFVLVSFSTCYLILVLQLYSISKGISLSSMCAPNASNGISLRNSSDLITTQNKLFNRQVGPIDPLGPRVFAVYGAKHQTHVYTRFSPIVWISGVPRSGTTLMRVILGTHPSVRCGPETRLIPRILQMHATWNASNVESSRLREGGISDRVVNSAISSFILELLTTYVEPEDVLCSKDPLALNYGMYINELFPNSKHILMIRDGRAVVYSTITRMHKPKHSAFFISSIFGTVFSWVLSRVLVFVLKTILMNFWNYCTLFFK